LAAALAEIGVVDWRRSHTNASMKQAGADDRGEPR
jgi:hypothetical protein